MTKQEFLLMQEQDLTTHQDREQLLPVLECMKEVLKAAPADAEIDAKKTVEGCFGQMRAEAQKKQKNQCYYMGPTEALKVVADYLDIKISTRVEKSKKISLEDYL